MQLQPIDLAYLAEHFEELASPVIKAWEGDETPSPALVARAMEQLFDVLRRCEPGMENPLEPAELNELGEYGLKLLEEMAGFAADLGMSELSNEIEDLCFPFAVWLCREGVELTLLEPVVNALARLANQISNGAYLAHLYQQINEIIDATSPMVSEDPDRTDPMRPWRVLIMNQAIVATRTQDPRLMHRAFELLIERLPEDAPGFFEEGLEQMESLDYPQAVREIMQRYFMLQGVGRTLH